MKITIGMVFLLMGSLLVSLGLVIPTQNHQGIRLMDAFALLLMWCFSLSVLKFHENIFRKDKILFVVMPVLFVGFIWLLLNVGYLLSFGVGAANLYAILLGWGFFNSGLYYDTRKVLKEESAKG
jgi:hypothetical protein